MMWHASGITSRCKFCGGEGMTLPVLNLGYGRPDVHYVYAVGCPRCDTHTVHGETPREAVDNWNKQIYSDDTYLLRESYPMTDAGAETMVAAILADLSEAYIRARLMSMVSGGEKKDRNLWAKESRECRQGIVEWCSEAGLDYTGVLRELDHQVVEGQRRCVKAWKNAIREFFTKKGHKNDTDQ